MVPLDVRKGLSALKLMIPGNLAWSQFTPRYEYSRTASDSHSKTVVYGSQHSLHGPHNERNGEHLILESHTVKNTQNDPGILPFASSDSSGMLASRVQLLLSSNDQVKTSPFRLSEDRSSEAVKIAHNVPRMHIGEYAAFLTRHSLPRLDEEASPRTRTLVTGFTADAIKDSACAFPIHRFPSIKRRQKCFDRCSQHLGSGTWGVLHSHKINGESASQLLTDVSFLRGDNSDPWLRKSLSFALLWISGHAVCAGVTMSRLDNIQDSSPLRRGRPSAHTIFGQAWTINSAEYLFVSALKELQKLNNSHVLVHIHW